MNLTPDQKQHAVQLLQRGNKLEAVKYFKETLNISLKDAHALTEKLQGEVGSVPARPFGRIPFNTSGQKIGNWVGLIFMALGGIMLVIVFFNTYSTLSFEGKAVHAKGKVIDYATHQSEDDDGHSTTMYAAVFEYRFNGQNYQSTTSTSSSSPDYSIGQEIDVLVDPKNASDAMIDNFSEKWFLALVLGIMGTVFTGMGYMAYRIFGRR